MTTNNPTHLTRDMLPRVCQELKLSCRQCGKSALYDVGTIFRDRKGEGATAEHRYSFSNYFRCRDCGSGGPWEIEDFKTVAALERRAKADAKFAGLLQGVCALFDGTIIQTPAMGEDHLRQLLEREPGSAFLHTRLGNLFRGSGDETKATEWYQRALKLDPDDLEARYHLFSFAKPVHDIPTALTHASILVRCFLEGRRTDTQELTEGLALSLVRSLREAPVEFRRLLLDRSGSGANYKENLFMRTLLTRKGDEDQIEAAAVERLLAGPATTANGGAATSSNSLPRKLDLAPSLREVVEREGLDPKNLSVGVVADDAGHVPTRDRHSIPVSDGDKAALWSVPSLRELLRGSRTPPRDMSDYPLEYSWHFIYLEDHLVTLCDVKGDRTDQEIEEIYATLRRRPDGASLGDVHDFMWQVAALLVGTQAVSAAELEAIFEQLRSSARKWAQKPVSRNYVAFLRQNLRDGKD